MQIEAIGIIGASGIGASLAELLASNGFQVRIYDDFKDSLNVAMAKIKWSLLMQGKGDLMTNIESIQEYSKFHGADLVIEALDKTMDERALIFNRIIKEITENSIIALSAGVIPIKSVLENIPALPAERTIGLHFVNPVKSNPLVEIIRSDMTAEGVTDLASQVLAALGKIGIIVRDNPGQIVERLARVYVLAAFRILYSGKGLPNEIDSAFKEVSGAKYGPFEYVDFVGLDHDYNSCLNIWEMLGKPDRMKPSDLEMRLVQYGQLGKKATIGIYIYEDGRIVGENPMLPNIVKYLGLRSCEKEEIFSDIITSVLDEARVLASEIMASEHDIETSTKHALGWAKGPFAYSREKPELFRKKNQSEFDRLDAF